MRQLIPLLILMVLAVGCQPAKSVPVTMIDWNEEIRVIHDTKQLATSNKAAIDVLMSARKIPQALEPKSSMITNAAFFQELVNDPVSEIPVIEDPAPGKVESAPIKEPAIVETPTVPEVPYSAPSIPVASSVKRYSTGKPTYGAARQTNVRTETRTRKEKREILVDVPYEVKIPVYSRPKFKTVVEEYDEPVQVKETVMVSKTVMVPQEVTKTVMQKKRKVSQVPDGMEEVAAPTSTYSTAPTSTYSTVPESEISYASESVRTSEAYVSQPDYVAPTYASPPVIVKQERFPPVYATSPIYASAPIITPRQEKRFSTPIRTRFSGGSKQRNCTNGNCR